MTNQDLKQNYYKILQDIETCSKSKKVKIVAVSKTKSSHEIIELYNLGQKDFAENYAQEAASKINFINTSHKNIKITWHYIGKIQSNKIKLITKYFDWIQSIDNTSKAKKINIAAQDLDKKINILLQINLQADQAKNGIENNIDTIFNIVENILPLANLNLKGLMCILQQAENYNFDNNYQYFKSLADILNLINQKYNIDLDTLSMGMSNDYQAAIAAGSNMIRIGTKLFGDRA
jgi:pyridoxal phosphate enzyme (YggS family)